MKKIISLITAVICLSMSAVVFADDSTGIYSDFDLKKEGYGAIQMIGIMSGYEDGSFRPDNTITRAEFIKSLIIEYEDAYKKEIEKADIAFSDLDKNHWSYDYIAKAVKVGFVSGYEDGSFRPDENITYEQAVTMIFTMIGYAPVAEMYGGYPTAYMSLGYYNKFFKTSIENRRGPIEMNDRKAKTSVIRRDAAEMLQTALFIPICTVTDYKQDSDGSLKPLYVLGGDSEVKQTLYSMGHIAFWKE